MKFGYDDGDDGDADGGDDNGVGDDNGGDDDVVRHAG